MQVILDSSFARSGSAPIWGGKKGEFRDWTKIQSDCIHTYNLLINSPTGVFQNQFTYNNGKK